MKCVCNTACQVRSDAGRILTCDAGQVMEFEKCPEHFSTVAIIEEMGIDFLTATKELLQMAKWRFSEAHAAIYDAYGVELIKDEGTTKADLVEQILDARYRQVD